MINTPSPHKKRPEPAWLRAIISPRYHLNFPRRGRFPLCNGRTRHPLLLVSGVGRESHLFRSRAGNLHQPFPLCAPKTGYSSSALPFTGLIIRKSTAVVKAYPANFRQTEAGFIKIRRVVLLFAGLCNYNRDSTSVRRFSSRSKLAKKDLDTSGVYKATWSCYTWRVLWKGGGRPP